MKVVLADYGAGNLRSVASALERAGCEPVVIRRPGGVREAPLAVIAGVGHVESAARGPRDARARRGDARAGGRGPAGARHLRRHAAPLRGERGGRSRPRSARAARAPLARETRSAHGLERARADAAVCASRRPRGRGRLLRPQLRRRRGCGRRRAWPRSSTTAPSSRPSSRARWRASSSTPSAAAPPAPVCSRTSCDGQEARDPVPRRRRRPRWSRACASSSCATSATRSSWRRATRSSAADELVFLDITATLEDRGPTLGLVERAAEELSIPFTVGGGVSGLEDARALLRAGADKVAVNRAAFDDPPMLTALADEFGAQAVVCAVDARARRGRHPRAVATRAGATRWTGRRKPLRAARGRSCSPRSTPTGRARATTSR